MEENQNLRHIHSALLNTYVEDQMPKDAQFIGDADALERLKMTPKTTYQNVYNSMMNQPHGSCTNTLGFDDGLQRMRSSNFRRTNSSEQFILENNGNMRGDGPMQEGNMNLGRN